MYVFQTIWPVYRVFGQFRTKGRIVNVPVSVDPIVRALPCLPSNDDVIHVRLARQMHVQRITWQVTFDPI